MSRAVVPATLYEIMREQENRLRRTEMSPFRLVPWHSVGASGEPAFGPFWQNYSPVIEPSWMTARFRKINDTVSLSGVVTGGLVGGGYSAVFTLPDGYRPTANIFFVNELVISVYGDVSVPGSWTRFGLDGISFSIT